MASPADASRAVLPPRRAWGWILAFAAAASGCGVSTLSSEEPDASAVGRDGPDGGAVVDAGTVPEAGHALDGGQSGDGGQLLDGGTGPDGGTGTDAGTDAGVPLQVCACWLSNGDYCGQIALDHAAASNCAIPPAQGNATNLMTCSNGAWSVKQVCSAGCTFRPGLDDICASPNGFKLPWAKGVAHSCTQGHNQGSHTGTGLWAWDFGLAANTPVLAARAGTVSIATFFGATDACWNGVPAACTSCTATNGVDCTNRGNRVVINHGDGTQSLYLHLWAVDVAVGQAVAQGQQIGKSGASGCACGAHLHYMVSSANNANYYSQSISSSFVEAGDPGTGAVVTSQNP